MYTNIRDAYRNTFAQDLLLADKEVEEVLVEVCGINMYQHAGYTMAHMPEILEALHDRDTATSPVSKIRNMSAERLYKVFVSEEMDYATQLKYLTAQAVDYGTRLNESLLFDSWTKCDATIASLCLREVQALLWYIGPGYDASIERKLILQEAYTWYAYGLLKIKLADEDKVRRAVRFGRVVYGGNAGTIPMYEGNRTCADILEVNGKTGVYDQGLFKPFPESFIVIRDYISTSPDATISGEKMIMLKQAHRILGGLGLDPLSDEPLIKWFNNHSWPNSNEELSKMSSQLIIDFGLSAIGG